MIYILLKEDNTYEIIDNENRPELGELNKMVDGTIAHVGFNMQLGFYINDDGKYCKGRNDFATRFWHMQVAKNGLTTTDFIAGNAVYISHDDEGETKGLSQDEVQEFRAFYAEYEKIESPFTHH